MSTRRTIEKLNEVLFSSRDRIYSILNTTDTVTLFIALSTLVYSLGFDLEADETTKIFGWLEALIVVFVIAYFVRLLYSFHRLDYIKERVLESLMVFVVLLASFIRLLGFDILYNLFLFFELNNFRAFYEFFIATYLIMLTMIGFARASQVVSKVKIRPAATFIFSFILLIFLGTFLLMMPAMTTRPGGMGFLDALFTSTSASCVTGLSVVTAGSYFTLKGQFIILILIQLGGIGIVSFATFFATFLSKGVGMKQQAIIQDVLSSESLSSAKSMLRQIILLTFGIELVGAIAIYFTWGQDVNFYTPVILDEPYYTQQVYDPSQITESGTTQKEDLELPNEDGEVLFVDGNEEEEQEISKDALEIPKGVVLIENGRNFGTIVSYAKVNNSWTNKVYYSIFHSVSAFCNAGFSLFPDGLGDKNVSKSYALHLIVAFIIIFGSLGFSNIQDIFSPHKLRERFKMPWKKWSLGTQIAVNMTIILTIFGMVAYFYLEQQKTLEGQNLQEQIITAFFQSVTTRTAGFNTVDMSIETFAVPTYIMFLFLMFVGAASGSTGGGIKTSTFLLLVFSASSNIQGKKTVEIGKRTIATDTINRAFAIVAFAIGYNAVCIFVLSIVQDADIRVLFFEQISAFATVGLSLGITSSLNEYSQAILIFTMYIGRVGTLTLALALSKRVKSTSYQYPSAHVMVG